MTEEKETQGAGQRQQIRFTPGQAKTIASSLTVLAASVVIAFCGVFVWLIALFFNTFSGVLMPLLVAAVLTLLLKPFYNWLHDKRGLKPALAVAVIMLSFILPLLVLLGFSGFIIFSQAAALVENIPGWYQKIATSGGEYFPQIQSLWNEYAIGARLTDFLQTHTAEIATRFQDILSSTVQAGLNASSWLGSLFGWIMVPVYLAFFLTLPPFKPEDMESGLPFLKSATRKDVVSLLSS